MQVRAVLKDSGNSVLDEKFDVLGLIGRGRLSIVYLVKPNASSQKLSRTEFAAKVLIGKASQAALIAAQLRHEACALTASAHPNVVRIYDCVVKEEISYLLLEYVNRGDLFTLRKKGENFSFVENLRIIKKVLLALDQVHATGIIHRDVKPENILIDDHGGVKLSDFGVSLLPDHFPQYLGPAKLVGTFEYLAPEVLTEGRYGIASDIYSVGVVLYELLCGKFPFSDKSLSDQVGAKLKNNYSPLPMDIQKNHPKLEKVIARALAGNPKSRFPNAQAFINELRLAIS